MMGHVCSSPLPSWTPPVVILSSSGTPALQSAGCWLDSRCLHLLHRPGEGVSQLHPLPTWARRLRCSSVLSLMMMDDSRDAPWTCFDSRTGSKDDPPLARTVESASLNSQSGEFQLEPQLHFLALEHTTSEKLLRILKTPTLAP